MSSSTMGYKSLSPFIFDELVHLNSFPWKRFFGRGAYSQSRDPVRHPGLFRSVPWYQHRWLSRGGFFGGVLAQVLRMRDVKYQVEIASWLGTWRTLLGLPGGFLVFLICLGWYFVIGLSKTRFWSCLLHDLDWYDVLYGRSTAVLLRPAFASYFWSVTLMGWYRLSCAWK